MTTPIIPVRTRAAVRGAAGVPHCTRATRLISSTLREQDRSIEAVVATEAPVLAFDLRTWSPILEVLRMDGYVAPDQVPMLDTHDRSTITRQLGSTREFRRAGDQLIARNYYGESAAGNDAWLLVKGGHLRDNSIGYDILEWTDIEPGATAEVGGLSYTAPAGSPLRITTKWKIKENSNCAIGADPDAKMRAQSNPSPSNPPPTNNKGVNMKFTPAQIEFLVAQGLAAEADAETAETFYTGLSQDLRDECDALAEDTAPAAPTRSSRAAAPTSPDIIAAQEAARAVYVAEMHREAARVAAIRTEAAQHGIDAETITRCITEGMDLAAARAAFLTHIRTRPTVPYMAVPNADVATRTHMEAALLLRANCQDIAVASLGADVTQQADERLRNASLLDMCRMSVATSGMPVPHHRDELIRAGFTTGALSVVLGNTANKLLLRGYNAAAKSWRTWCNIGNINDFKPHKIARMNDLGEMEAVGRGGEVNYSARSEDAEEIVLDTYAKNFAVTRQDIIDDDLGVFTRVPQGHGVKAAQRVSKLVYTHLLSNPVMSDTVALFHSDHKNLNTSSALGSDNLGAAIAKFFQQIGPDGEPIEVMPAYLIVPPELEQLAKQLIRSQLIMPVGDTDGKFPTLNVHADTLKGVVSDPRLSSSVYTGYSATSWYLSADPTQADTCMVGFLDGRDTPTLERFDAGPDRLGLIYRVYLDFGVRVVDHRTLQKNNA